MRRAAQHPACMEQIAARGKPQLRPGPERRRPASSVACAGAQPEQRATSGRDPDPHRIAVEADAAA